MLLRMIRSWSFLLWFWYWVFVNFGFPAVLLAHFSYKLPGVGVTAGSLVVHASDESSARTRVRETAHALVNMNWLRLRGGGDMEDIQQKKKARLHHLDFGRDRLDRPNNNQITTATDRHGIAGPSRQVKSHTSGVPRRPDDGQEDEADERITLDQVLKRIARNPNPKARFSMGNPQYHGVFELVRMIHIAPETEPWDVAIGPDTLLYVADPLRNRVLVLDPTNGTRVNLDDCPSVRQKLNEINHNFQVNFIHEKKGHYRLSSPCGVAFTSQGMLCVADSGQSRVLRLRTDGALVDIMCRPGKGPGLCSYPYSLCPFQDSLFVVDPMQGVVQRLTNKGMLDYYLHANLSQEVLLPDENSTIQWDQLGKWQDGRTFGTKKRFAYPNGATVGPSLGGGDKRLFVADSQNNIIRAFDVNDGKSLGAFGGIGSGPLQFNHPTSVSMPRDGVLVVGDYKNKRLQALQISQVVRNIGSVDGV